MELNEVREKFLNFMEENGHKVIPSFPIIPTDDATTLFTGSGMQPLLQYLLGNPHPDGTRVTDSQKCFRANDIDEVGDNRHTTFFEMLGNWSFGDYFKKEQIKNCFIFLTDKEKGLGLDPKNLYVTVFAGDKKSGIQQDTISAEIWQEVFASVGIDAKIANIGSTEYGDKHGMKEGERIFYYDASKNWWSRSGEPSNMPVGEPGGPDTEIFFDFGEEYTDDKYKHLEAHPNTDSGRFIEICNSVFMEYIKTDNGFDALPQKNVDFGAGLERLTAATIKNPDIFQIDIFKNLIGDLEKESKISYAKNPKPFRVIADHLRSALFIIADGVVPSNTDRGYVLRRLIREAIYNFQYELSITNKTLSSFSNYILSKYEKQYPDLIKSDSETILKEEEDKFNKTLKKGVKVFQGLLEKGDITGEDVFTLQSTYGLPKELTIKLSEQRGIKISIEEYKKAMEKHKQSSRQASEKKFKGGLEDTGDINVRSHTATHLLYQALRDILGDEVRQKGCNITSERIRFDFSFDRKMTDEEIKKVEKTINQKIENALPVTHKDMSIEDAKKIGAMGVFEYGDVVKVYSIGDYSIELCGGPHVDNTSKIGKVSIIKEESVSKGVRRIKAVI